MAQTIKIKRSTSAGSPSALENGELAYSSNTNILYVGRPGGTTGDIDAIGGKAYMDLLDHTAGTLTASSAVIVDANSKIDIFNVDNLRLDGNTISSTDTGGNITITPDTTGNIVLDGQTWPNAVGTNGYFLQTDGSGNLSWAEAATGIDLNSLTAAVVDVTADSIAIVDASDSNASRKESIADLITAVAGNGLGATTGVLAVNVDGSSIEINADTLRVKALGITNGMLVNDSTFLGSTELGLGNGTGTVSTVDGLEVVHGVDGSGTDIAGTNLTIKAGAGTGTGAGGSIVFQTADGGTTGSTLNTFATALTIADDGTVTIAGNLTVQGTTTTVDSNTVNIGDNILVLNADETGTPSQNGGIEIERGTETNAQLIWDEANDYWAVAGATSGQILLAGGITEEVQDIVGGQFVTNGTHTNISAVYDDAGDGAIDLTVATATGAASQGSGTKGVAEFNTSYFTVTSGWVDLTAVDGGTYS